MKLDEQYDLLSLINFVLFLLYSDVHLTVGCFSYLFFLVNFCTDFVMIFSTLSLIYLRFLFYIWKVSNFIFTILPNDT